MGKVLQPQAIAITSAARESRPTTTRVLNGAPPNKAMRFRAKYVSASENGDYYQVEFENMDAARDAADVYGPDSPYLLIQR